MKREELENELFTLCSRLRRSLTASELDGARPLPSSELEGRPQGQARRARAATTDAPATRCYMTLAHYADADLPRLLEADEHVRALLGALNEAASLLYYFAQHERRTKRGDRHLPS